MKVLTTKDLAEAVLRPISVTLKANASKGLPLSLVERLCQDILNAIYEPINEMYIQASRSMIAKINTQEMLLGDLTKEKEKVHGRLMLQKSKNLDLMSLYAKQKYEYNKDMQFIAANRDCILQGYSGSVDRKDRSENSKLKFLLTRQVSMASRDLDYVIHNNDAVSRQTMPIVKSVESSNNAGGLRYSNAIVESELGQHDLSKHSDDHKDVRISEQKAKKHRPKNSLQRKPSRLRKYYTDGLEISNNTPNNQTPQELEHPEIKIEKEPGSHRPVDKRTLRELPPKVDYKSRVDQLPPANGQSDRYLPILSQSELREIIMPNKKHSNPVRAIPRDAFKNLGLLLSTEENIPTNEEVYDKGILRRPDNLDYRRFGCNYLKLT